MRVYFNNCSVPSLLNLLAKILIDSYPPKSVASMESGTIDIARSSIIMHDAYRVNDFWERDAETVSEYPTLIRILLGKMGSKLFELAVNPSA